MRIRLFHGEGSNCCQRVKWTLAYKGIPHDLMDVDSLEPGAYEGINPFDQVPSIEVDGRYLIEASAILEWLEETFPEPALLPRDSWLRAQVRAICSAVASGIHPVQTRAAIEFLAPSRNKDEVNRARRAWIEARLSELLPLLFKDSAFCVGNEVSLADFHVAVIFLKALTLGANADQFPEYRRHIAACYSDEQIRNSCPGEIGNFLTQGPSFL